ncbi:hypothetical protein PHLGIDRAFT_120454 [Phlebiopsis gigantea 11061_1 CR5-6]|uniref:Uncharacterized protein n=1 Tax=Phlebiopsis gigantea (strain 11061_1 CR5-6) TaxID=745531 RepID=A0A0C3S7J1_PHLG1|nr:hypothetical protein PHLGIDRAFT_120454 [Phlebiopsis gigantea 11061_1 CR5-6]
MQAIAKDIRTCASTCDSFQKKKLIVKVFKSIAWEGKLSPLLLLSSLLQGEFDHHISPALWKFALDAILHAVRV